MCASMIPTLVDFPKDGPSSWPTEEDRKLLIIFWKTVLEDGEGNGFLHLTIGKEEILHV